MFKELPEIFPGVGNLFLINKDRVYKKNSGQKLEEMPELKARGVICGYLFNFREEYIESKKKYIEKENKIWLTKSGDLYCTALSSPKVNGKFKSISVSYDSIGVFSFLCLTISKSLILLHFSSSNIVVKSYNVYTERFKIAGIPNHEKISTVHHNKHSVFLQTENGKVYAFAKCYPLPELKNPLKFSLCKCLQNVKKLVVTDDCVMFFDKMGGAHYVLNYSEHHSCSVSVPKCNSCDDFVVSDCGSGFDGFFPGKKKDKKIITAIVIETLNGPSNIIDICLDRKKGICLTKSSYVYCWGEALKPKKIKEHIISISLNNGVINVIDKEGMIYCHMMRDSIIPPLKWHPMGKLPL